MTSTTHRTSGLTRATAGRAAAARTGVARSGVAPRHDLRAWTRFSIIAMLLLATVPFAGTARAQLPELPLPIGEEPSEEPTSEPTEEEEEGSPIPALPAAPGGDEAEGIKTAYFTAPTSDLLPGVLFDDTIQCVLVPETCTPDAEAILGPVREVLIGVSTGADVVTDVTPQPVPPGALPVGIVLGNQRYSSAIDIGPPEVGDGKTVDEYTVTMQMSALSFSIESPAFRELTTAAVSQAGTGSPEDLQAFVESVAAQETPLFTQEFPGLEACVIAEPWDAGDNQPAEAEPSIGDGFFCSEQAKPDEAGVITFDLTFAAQESLNPTPIFPIDWSNGLLIRPLGAQNLAYGDADYTTNYYAYFEDPVAVPPVVSVNEVDAPEPYTPPENTGSPGSSGSTSGSSSSSSTGSSGSRGTSSSSSSASSGSSSLPSSPASTSSSIADTATMASPGDVGGSDIADVAAVAEQVPQADDLVPANDTSGSFPFAWILLPMMLGGAFWYGRVLDTSPVVQDIVRSGAMTRLLRQRGFQV